jgi:hypothetical protein
LVEHKLYEDLLAVYLTSVHVLHRFLTIRVLFIFHIRVAGVDKVPIGRKVDTRDFAVDAEYFQYMISSHVA